MIKRLGLDKYSALYLWAFFIIVFGTWHPDTFLTMTTAKTVLIENVIVGVLAISFLVPLATGTYDLSIGTMMTMSLVIVNSIAKNDTMPQAAGMFIALAACAVVGFISGFIVVKLDGRGTPRRGREFERAIKGDFATITAGDQIAGLQQLLQRVPEMDAKRVGVYGWSFGGYLAALLALSKPEQIRCAVAGAPVVDWYDYDTHYTERYLGVPQGPNDKAYQVSSLLTYVADAKRPILLMHGTADDNVYFMHTLKLSDAMFKAGKAHSVLPLSNFTHMVPDPLVMQRQWERIAGYFKENL